MTRWRETANQRIHNSNSAICTVSGTGVRLIQVKVDKGILSGN